MAIVHSKMLRLIQFSNVEFVFDILFQLQNEQKDLNDYAKKKYYDLSQIWNETPQVIINLMSTINSNNFIASTNARNRRKNYNTASEQRYRRPRQKQQISLREALRTNNIDDGESLHRLNFDDSHEMPGSLMTDEEVNRQSEINRMREQILRSNKPENRKECPICFEEMPLVEHIPFDLCQHHYCTNCHVDSMLNSIDSFSLIKCCQEGCQQVLLDQNSTLLKLLPSNYFYKYYRILIHNHANTNKKIRLCPTESCIGIVQLDVQPAKCVICKKEYCPLCMNKKHRGNCDEHENSYIQDTFKFAKCPNCGIMVEKLAGCHHITCRCKFQFCYLCSNAWQREHRCQRRRRPEVQHFYEEPAALPPENNRRNTECNFSRCLKCTLYWLLLVYFDLACIFLAIFVFVFTTRVLLFALKGLSYTVFAWFIPEILCAPRTKIECLRNIVAFVLVVPMLVACIIKQTIPLFVRARQRIGNHRAPIYAILFPE